MCVYRGGILGFKIQILSKCVLISPYILCIRFFNWQLLDQIPTLLKSTIKTARVSSLSDDSFSAIKTANGRQFVRHLWKCQAQFQFQSSRTEYSLDPDYFYPPPPTPTHPPPG